MYLYIFNYIISSLEETSHYLNTFTSIYRYSKVACNTSFVFTR